MFGIYNNVNNYGLDSSGFRKGVLRMQLVLCRVNDLSKTTAVFKVIQQCTFELRIHNHWMHRCVFAILLINV